MVHFREERQAIYSHSKERRLIGTRVILPPHLIFVFVISRPTSQFFNTARPSSDPPARILIQLRWDLDQIYRQNQQLPDSLARCVPSSALSHLPCPRLNKSAGRKRTMTSRSDGLGVGKHCILSPPCMPSGVASATPVSDMCTKAEFKADMVGPHGLLAFEV